MSLILRAAKGSPLTIAEGDGNFTYLQGLIAAIEAKNTIRNGSGVPDDSLGVDGDYYIDNTDEVIYGPKAAGAWPGSGVSFSPADIDIKAATTLWVSPTGNNATGEKGKIGKPYLTIAGAETDSASGDMIIVHPGTYNERVAVVAKLLHIHFMPGVTLRAIKCTGNGQVYFSGRPNFLNADISNIDADKTDLNATFCTKGSTSFIKGQAGNISNTSTAFIGSNDTGSTLQVEANNIVHTGAAEYAFKCIGHDLQHTIQDIKFNKMTALSVIVAGFGLWSPSTVAPKSYVRVSGNKLITSSRCYFNQYGGGNSIAEQVIDVHVKYNQSLNLYVASGGANGTDLTNKFQFIRFTDCQLISEINDTLVMGDKVYSGRYPIGLYLTGCMVMNRYNNAAAPCIFIANNAGVDGYFRVQNSSLISKYGTYTVNAQVAAAQFFYNHGGNSYNKTTNNTTIIGPAITAYAGYIEYPIEIPQF